MNGLTKIECPVCENEFEKENGYECQYKDEALYLCSMECKQEFEDHPQNFIELDE